MFASPGIHRSFTWLAAAAMLLVMGCSEEPPADPNAKMREIYYLSDLPGSVRPVQLYVEQALDQQTKIFTPEQLEIAREVVRREFTPKKIEQEILNRLAEQAQRDYLDEATAWLKTPMVERFMQSKASAWSPAGLLEMKSYAEDLEENPLSEKRKQLIDRFDAATNSSGFAAETMLLSAYAVAVMHDAIQPEEDRLGPAELRESMISQRSVLLPIFKQTSRVAIGFSFRDATDAEVEEFIEFVESPPGQWLYKTTSSNFLNALLSLTANIGGIYRIALPESSIP